MFDAMQATTAYSAPARGQLSLGQDNSFTVVLTIGALGLLLSLMASAISPEWLLALSM